MIRHFLSRLSPFKSIKYCPKTYDFVSESKSKNKYFDILHSDESTFEDRCTLDRYTIEQGHTSLIKSTKPFENYTTINNNSLLRFLIILLLLIVAGYQSKYLLISADCQSIPCDTDTKRKPLDIPDSKKPYTTIDNLFTVIFENSLVLGDHNSNDQKTFKVALQFDNEPSDVIEGVLDIDVEVWDEYFKPGTCDRIAAATNIVRGNDNHSLIIRYVQPYVHIYIQDDKYSRIYEINEQDEMHVLSESILRHKPAFSSITVASADPSYYRRIKSEMSESDQTNFNLKWETKTYVFADLKQLEQYCKKNTNEPNLLQRTFSIQNADISAKYAKKEFTQNDLDDPVIFDMSELSTHFDQTIPFYNKRNYDLIQCGVNIVRKNKGKTLTLALDDQISLGNVIKCIYIHDENHEHLYKISHHGRLNEDNDIVIETVIPNKNGIHYPTDLARINDTPLVFEYGFTNLMDVERNFAQLM